MSTSALVFTILSMGFYTVVFLPQLWIIYSRKSSDGISLAMVSLWCLADTLGLLGVYLLQLDLNLVIIAWFHIILAFILLLSVLAYKSVRTIYEIVFIIAFTITNFVVCTVIASLSNSPQLSNFIIGYILAWCSTSLFIFGRIPQIWMNFKRRSTKGLSVFMFVFSIFGNVSYMSSILSISLDHEYIIKNMSLIFFTISSVGLDVVVISQIYLYKNIDNTNRITDV